MYIVHLMQTENRKFVNMHIVIKEVMNHINTYW